MTPRTLRLVLGFLLAFVSLSLVPRAQDLSQLLADPLVLIGLTHLGVGLALSAVAIALYRRLRSWRPGPLLSVVPGNDLGYRIRLAARNGARTAELARRFGLSQDAIRAALLHEHGTAAESGSSFRHRQAAVPERAAVRPIAARSTRYQIKA
jgi:hypothetical protein